MELKIKILRKFDFLKDICYQTSGSAGFDLYAAIESDIVISKFATVLVPSGIAIQLDNGYEAQIRSRSGLALKNRIIVLNSPATIDSDYRGEIGIILTNLGEVEFTVKSGMRIAQMVISKYEKASFNFVEGVNSSDRGVGGFGSTGV